uniref:ligase-associated DNA damage response endonuclease PdeM n=2 Tax=Algoriphagus sp. TaxID=1872435 RepID=UPI00404715B6
IFMFSRKSTPMISATITHSNLNLDLLFEKGVWIKELKVLLIADLHLGKATHYRKAGIPIPETIHQLDFLILEKLVHRFQPLHLYFLGDLFHSHWNEQWDYFLEFLKQFPQTNFHLIKGNHDILPEQNYRTTFLKIHSSPVTLGNLYLSHEPVAVPEKQLNICGHIHPGIYLKGRGKLSLRLPCYYWSNNTLVLPSFGNFTGLQLVEKKASDRIWVIGEDRVFPLLSTGRIG